MVGMINQNILNQIELDALKRNIPVMQKEGIEFIISKLKENNAKTLLEIGSAIGYSAMCFVNGKKNLQVETIELSNERYLEAQSNIKLYQFEQTIFLHHADALTFNPNDLKIKQFDCLFIDAAKAQYQKFFEKYIDYVKKDGIVIVDNLDFHGMVDDIENIKNRNTRQLVKKIKRFKDWIFNHELYDVTYYTIGDGIAIIKRKDIK